MTPRCSGCRHFQADGAAVEAAFPGLAALSSGYASVRAQDGLCGLHGIYLPGGDGCASFAPDHPLPVPSQPGQPRSRGWPAQPARWRR